MGKNNPALIDTSHDFILERIYRVEDKLVKLIDYLRETELSAGNKCRAQILNLIANKY